MGIEANRGLEMIKTKMRTKEILNAIAFSKGATAMLEHEGRPEWDIWIYATKVDPILTINLHCNGESRPQATLYGHGDDGIDLDTALDLF